MRHRNKVTMWDGPLWGVTMFGLAMEAQQVIALRMMKLALGGPAAAEEAERMVSEKTDAAHRAAGAMMLATARGRPDQGSAAVMSLVRRTVRANRKRLSGG